MNNQVHETDNQNISNRLIAFLARRLRNINGMTLNQLKWLTVLAPPILIGAFEFTRHSPFWESLLPLWIGNLLEMAVVMAGTFIFSQIVFGVIERLVRENDRRRREAEAFFEVGTEITKVVDRDSLLKLVVEHARRVLNCDIAVLSLLHGADAASARVAATSGITPQQIETISAGIDKHLPLKAALVTRKPTLLSCPNAAALNIQCHLTAPLVVADRSIGTLCVGSRQPLAFASDEARQLSVLANLAAIAIQNANLHDRTRQVAVLEERDRIAGELHDDLAQTLNYINLKASMASEQLRSGKISQVDSGLLELKEIATEASTNVREAIYNLRTDMVSGPGLIPALEEYARIYRAYYAMDVRLAVESGYIDKLDRAVHVQIIRILQEALANARKHASAREVWIRINQNPCECSFCVEDNGNGFDTRQLSMADRPHFGLQMMRERAESIGGSLELDSDPGSGTRVKVRVPCGVLRGS